MDEEAIQDALERVQLAEQALAAAIAPYADGRLKITRDGLEELNRSFATLRAAQERYVAVLIKSGIPHPQ